MLNSVSNTLIESNGNVLSAQCGVNGNPYNVDAKLAPFASNGGPMLTLRLLAGSPTSNADSNSTNQATDQRGVQRVEGTSVDLSAYEAPQVLLSPATPT